MTITAEIDCHTIVGTPKSAVVAFSSKLKTITETAKLAVITIGRAHLRLASPSIGTTDPPIITGRRGRIHGAATVSIPASSDTIKSVICFYLKQIAFNRFEAGLVIGYVFLD